jgi:hypothetical protein
MSQRPPSNNPPNNDAFNNPANMGSDDQAVRALRAVGIVAEQQRQAYWLIQGQEHKSKMKMDQTLRQKQQQQAQAQQEAHQQQHARPARQQQAHQQQQARQQARQQQHSQQQQAQEQLQQQQQARQPPNDQVVIMIDDDSEDSNEDDAATNAFMQPRMTNRELKRQREAEAAGRPDPPAQKRRPPQPPPSRLRPDGSHPLPPGFAPLVTQAPAAARNAGKNADKGGALAGPFVSGVLSGRLLTTERENNRNKALSNVLLCATGHTVLSAPKGMPFPPPTVHLNIRQVQVLADGFLDDRNNAVNEAVRIAYMEMKSKHEEIVLRNNTGDFADEMKVLTAKMVSEKKEHAKEKQKLSDEVERLKGLHRSQLVAIKHLQKARDEETATLKTEIKRLHAQKAVAPRAATTVDSEEVEELREKLKHIESRHARSLSAYVSASVHSFRMLRRNTNVIPDNDNIGASDKEA